MEEKKLRKPSGKKGKSQLALRGGSYSLLISVVVLAILVVVNVLAGALPSSATKLDMSATQLYSITSNTKVVVNSLQDDITIYWIVQSGEENDVIENLLSKYESLSDHIEVVKKNPDVYPTFAEQYTDEEVENNSLIVVCGERSRFVSYSDIYVQDVDYTTYSYTSSFDGEGAITSAIDYVTTDELQQIYVLTGHGESDLPSGFSDQIEKANIEVNDLTLLNVDEIPEDAACIVIYAPTSDISEEEKKMLSEYAENGGKLLVMAGPAEDDELTNLYSILSDYGIEKNEGIVVEGDREHYAFQVPYVLMPDMASNTITDSLIEENYNVLMPISLGLTVSDDASGDATVTELLTTSDDAFSKIAGYDISTYEKEDGDLDGPFTLAVSVETANSGEIIWFASSAFLDDTYNSYSSGANLDLSMNALSSLVGETEAMAIRSKSLDYNYLTISESTSAALKAVMIGVIPLAYLGVGICVVVMRRRKSKA